MCTPLIAGNWKMNKTFVEAVKLVADMLPGLTTTPGVEVLLCPPFTSLMAISTLIGETAIHLGAQNMHWEASGAFTGEISPQMVKEFCSYIIIGHSERRAYFGDTDEVVNRKFKAALEQKLTPILCVGETLEEREAEKTGDVITRQLREGLRNVFLKQGATFVVAYEPVWAIGTGRASSSKDANQVIADYIRPTLQSIFDKRVAESTRILYGGSVKPENAAEYFSQPDIDGALVGGAALKPDFTKIVEAAA